MTTKAEEKALAWLKDHGGSGAMQQKRKSANPDKWYMLAGGEWAPFMPSTWRGLEQNKFVAIDRNRVTVL